MNRLKRLAGKHGIPLARRGDHFAVRMNARGDKRLLAFFSEVNGYPHAAVPHFRCSRKPLVSCVILLTFNDLFVKNVLIPSIIRCSPGQPIEIIVVYNGDNVDVRKFKKYRLFRSEKYNVSKGYNLGVKHARGEYVAVFHDDCLLNDPDWISKLESLNRYFALTGELRDGAIIKNVPLVMRRDRYRLFGGFNEELLGSEDREFSGRVKAGDVLSCINSRHFRGMSTTLLFSRHHKSYRVLFGYNVLPYRFVVRLNGCILSKVNDTNVLQSSEHAMQAGWMKGFFRRFRHRF